MVQQVVINGGDVFSPPRWSCVFDLVYGDGVNGEAIHFPSLFGVCLGLRDFWVFLGLGFVLGVGLS